MRHLSTLGSKEEGKPHPNIWNFEAKSVKIIIRMIGQKE